MATHQCTPQNRKYPATHFKQHKIYRFSTFSTLENSITDVTRKNRQLTQLCVRKIIIYSDEKKEKFSNNNGKI